MGMTMYVVDVQSGEIISSESIQETVHAADLNVAAIYKNVAFGGSVFYRTPLGEATARVMDKAVVRVTNVIASQRWEPRVAKLRGDGALILNGGRDRELRPGVELEVIEPGPAIIDPDTGDSIGRESATAIAHVRVTEVEDHFSIASVISDKAKAVQVGQRCRRLDAARVASCN